MCNITERQETAQYIIENATLTCIHALHTILPIDDQSIYVVDVYNR
jgi:hypothetical protein